MIQSSLKKKKLSSIFPLLNSGSLSVLQWLITLTFPTDTHFFKINFFIDIHIEYSEGSNWLRDEFHVTNFFSIKLICISIAERGKHIFYSYLVYTIVNEIEEWIYF